MKNIKSLKDYRIKLNRDGSISKRFRHMIEIQFKRDKEFFKDSTNRKNFRQVTLETLQKSLKED